ncbi:hypothetical protein FEM48_Zijuj03G0170100 [Ziziphus jujuba var. spinosa]|uniref:Uncharacterized protein n=1 Tax=Ziziphus jujuba var. spinosa TaxID=714518 RepID=A0A978VRJ0_ZIZJJ|nr:hypothetical protein FEM48_Zijuj03G0170100 [Ziziphus jujuba var. spinosa]
MDHHRQNKKTKCNHSNSEEVSSIEWTFINMTEQEEDLIFRMHRLVGERGFSNSVDMSVLIKLDADNASKNVSLTFRTTSWGISSKKQRRLLGSLKCQFGICCSCFHRWDLIAGRIPGRKAEEIERFWIMRHRDMFAQRRKQQREF